MQASTRKWEYAQVAYTRNRQPSEPCIHYAGPAMDAVRPEATMHLDTFLAAAGQNGWELAGTLLPYPPGKQLFEEADDGTVRQYVVHDPLDIQWLIFKRQL
jgi:hypothetical protein